MATTDDNVTLTGLTKVPVLLSTSTSFSVQNTTTGGVGWAIKDSGKAGGVIDSGDVGIFDFDIDVWCMSSVGKSNIHIVRD